jgi:DNA-binding GntR family transcriptional regulator
VIEPNRGAFIPSLAPEEIDEIFDLRLMLESDALEHALTRHDRKTRLRLEALQAELEIEETRSGWIAGDRAFHEALYAPSGRRRTLELIRTLRAQTERYGLSRLDPGSRRKPWAEEHRALIRAIAKGDREKALGTLKLHLRETQAAVRAAIQQAER